MSASAFAAAERAARESYGRLLAWLAYQWRDVAAAEDALSGALVKALEHWPQRGVPDEPAAWLLSVARRELLQVARRQRLHDSPQVQALLDSEDGWQEVDTIPDSRLKLLFVCAHPAIDVAVRPALMLQTVLGLDASTVAQAMLTSPAAMAQRLVRAKQKVRDARLRFEEPGVDELPGRLHAVLEAVYAAYGLGWDAADGGQAELAGLRSEALYLGTLVCHLLPNSPEAMGLLALMQFCEARTGARHAADGSFVPLHEQDTQRWERSAIEHADQLLNAAAAIGEIGPFQIEAAIQSAHCQRLFSGSTPWAALTVLYAELLRRAPTLGAQVAHALVWAQAGDAHKAAHLLRALEHPRLESYQPYWVARAHVEGLIDDAAQATSLERAIGLSSSPSARDYLLALQVRLFGTPPRADRR